MGACSSSPAGEGTTLLAANSSPVNTAVTQVKEKRSDSAEANNITLDTAQSDSEAQPTAATDNTAPAATVSAAESASTATDGVSSRKEKESAREEESKEQQPQPSEQTVEIRPASASQQKLSARTVAPLPITAATIQPADTTAVTAASTATTTTTTTTTAAVSAEPVFGEAAADEFPTTLPASSQFSSSDLKYKSTVRDVLVLLLDRFTRTMEYEKAAFQELAIGVGYTNYMQLYDYAAFESFLRLNYVIPPSPSPQQQDNDLRYISQYFSLFLTLAQSGECDTKNRTMPTRQQLTGEMQSLCSATAEQLRKWCVSQHATAEVKEHLLFFSTALKFAEGDLINQPELLYKNIDDICA